MTKNYIQAVLMLLKAGTPVETVLVNLKRLLEKRGHSSLYGAVLRGLVSNFRLTNTSAVPQVIVANAKDIDSALVKKALLELQSNDTNFTTIIDESIIGGAIVSYKHRMIDQSYKTKLKNLYQSVITN
ncbi:hypothetical protein CO026_03445 [Candidatus Kaiserbacteria bacterium CG_4_9_14_0_2_um_filter_41_32]|uniref:Uncharacterized protein n=1 Tax=Candidatus Kaiserbacteria bacterium CG_4_9_14_0_2_um_filter_41_32 TaxID=1974601 RepID=A0A2M8FE34_9BACT|nr:MAG: hypothetical protein CO026_03445 [Candidatus Kaiserbacteria bacterium CG_4_9_14_0_2_um_filter_41_32]